MKVTKRGKQLILLGLDKLLMDVALNMRMEEMYGPVLLDQIKRQYQEGMIKEIREMQESLK